MGPTTKGTNFVIYFIECLLSSEIITNKKNRKRQASKKDPRRIRIDNPVKRRNK
ncbi:hypothetical protein Hanom_Chr02g00157451 [Helianthus anomalus]